MYIYIYVYISLLFTTGKRQLAKYTTQPAPGATQDNGSKLLEHISNLLDYVQLIYNDRQRDPN